MAEVHSQQRHAERERPFGGAHGQAGLAGAQQLVQTRTKVGQVGRVRFEVTAAGALVADRAFVTTSFDVTGFTAEPVRNCDCTDAGCDDRIDARLAFAHAVTVDSDLFNGADGLA